VRGTLEGLPLGQNARLGGEIAKETEGVTLVSPRHSTPQFQLHTYSAPTRDLPTERNHSVL
jgi:hypothetical protein